MVFSVADVVKELRSNRRLAHQVVDNLCLVASEPRVGTLNPRLPYALGAALAKQGIDGLWRHQVDGLEAVR